MRLVAGTVHEGRLRELSGHFFHGIHIAETGSHDHIVSLAGHVQKGPFGIRTFRNGFHKGGFHSGHGVYGLAALIMGIGPAFVSHRRNIDKTNLERFVFPGRGTAAQRRQRQAAQRGQRGPGFDSPKHENLLAKK